MSGTYTRAVSGGVLPNSRNRCRRAKTVPPQRKMACLWFELLQWFVDEIEELRSFREAHTLKETKRETQLSRDLP